ncbi:hypothetical protein PIB30_072446 [Stylosanthes scabra]|uniref:Uncharacterized protein n=1 Tax=Stylosanthes scabra TaxID=79078 RepID=A0ABU6TNQ6_9FABA|nr:hypothetical protein [Stylosanthes scabra]
MRVLFRWCPSTASRSPSPYSLLLVMSQWQPWFPPSVVVSIAFSITACREGHRGGLNNSFAVGFGVFHRWPTNPHRRPIAGLRSIAAPLRHCSELELGIKRHQDMSNLQVWIDNIVEGLK